MRVLMLGWEFPPMSSGGLGTACHGIVKALARQGIEVILVLPTHPGDSGLSNVNIIATDSLPNVKIRKIPTLLMPYMSSAEYSRSASKYKKAGIYGSNLFQEVLRYTQATLAIARQEKFDVIHAHDWMTYDAGIAAKKVSGKPLVLHIHATEFDRSGDNPNPYVYAIERKGFRSADAIVAVSNYTKSKVVQHYGIAPEKVKVVHNAVDQDYQHYDFQSPFKSTDKVVLFLGRMTLQKGPDYFIHAAHMVAHHEPNVKFILAGTGDMEPKIIEKAVEMGLMDKVLFTGFLSGPEVDKAYRMADLYVMPSVSEPFGITALEAMKNGTPVLMSRQSGASEVVTNCLKADFWVVHELAHKILSVIKYKELAETLEEEASREVRKFSWDENARKLQDIYLKVLTGAA